MLGVARFKSAATDLPPPYKALKAAPAAKQIKAAEPAKTEAGPSGDKVKKD